MLPRLSLSIAREDLMRQPPPESVKDAPPTEAGAPAPGAEGNAAADDELVLDDLLVEDVSIDGMCGVY
jgi:mycofactocin precursor